MNYFVNEKQCYGLYTTGMQNTEEHTAFGFRFFPHKQWMTVLRYADFSLLFDLVDVLRNGRIHPFTSKQSTETTICEVCTLLTMLDGESSNNVESSSLSLQLSILAHKRRMYRVGRKAD